ncbi:MAG: hypothetical protein ACP5O8_03405 [Candidatus Aenigmatarchaeota archaeon]
MFIFSILSRIFKKKETEEDKEEEKEEVKEEVQKPISAPRDTSIDKEEKDLIKSELKPGPFTEKFFELTPVKEKKKEEKE